MPLSEEELRLLEQMEQALAQEDPKFVSTLRGSRFERAARVRSVTAVGVFVLGVVLLMGGAVAAQVWLGVVGFLVMLGSATIGLATWRGRHSPASAAPAHPQEQEPFDLESLQGDRSAPQGFEVIDGGKTRSRRPRRPRRQRQARRHGTFMQRMEERWERRRREGGF